MTWQWRAALHGVGLVTAIALVGVAPAHGTAAKPAPHAAAAAPGSGTVQTVAPAVPLDLPQDLREQVDAMQDIRDIRPPVSYGVDPRWWVAAAGMGLLAATVPLITWLRRRRRLRTREAPGPPPVPPGELALAALGALRHEPDLGDKAFYFRLCEVVRSYLDRRFGADTLEKTTEELAPVLRGLPLEAGQRDGLIGLFRHADPVRYADASAALGRRDADLELAEAVVRAARAGCRAAEGDGAPLR